MVICPCGSLQSYRQCCQPLHESSQVAISAEQLMRSRYAAFVMGEIDYIVQTTVPAQQGLLDVQAITDWSQQNQWLGLSIIASQPDVKPRHAHVEFVARFKDQQGEQQHRELSSFVHSGTRWYFLDPTVQPMPSLKSDCLCGSGQKFKRCCAPFLGLL
ncbi:MAG: YchJ family protein [Moraxellaceae bacterium]|nr:MAG: YchJ family protein [Moraxellaceae bacterium]